MQENAGCRKGYKIQDAKKECRIQDNRKDKGCKKKDTRFKMYKDIIKEKTYKL